MFLNQSYSNGQKYINENLKHTAIKHFIKKIKYSLFQTVTTNNSKHFFQISYQKILTILESYYQMILYYTLFSESISNKTHTFRELLPKNSKNIFRVHIKHYWHFQGITSKLNCNEIFFQSSYHIIQTFSESCYQTILTYSELKSNSIHIFTELLPNNSKHYFESLNGHFNTQKTFKWKIPKYKWKKLAYTHETYHFAIKISRHPEATVDLFQCISSPSNR